MVITECFDECQPCQIKIQREVEYWLNPQPHLNILFNKSERSEKDRCVSSPRVDRRSTRALGLLFIWTEQALMEAFISFSAIKTQMSCRAVCTKASELQDAPQKTELESWSMILWQMKCTHQVRHICTDKSWKFRMEEFAPFQFMSLIMYLSNKLFIYLAFECRLFNSYSR